MVVVERGALLEPQVVPIAVVAIVLEHGDLVVAQAVDDAPHDGGLARSGPPATPITIGVMARHDSTRAARTALAVACALAIRCRHGETTRLGGSDPRTAAAGRGAAEPHRARRGRHRARSARTRRVRGRCADVAARSPRHLPHAGSRERTRRCCAGCSTRSRRSTSGCPSTELFLKREPRGTRLSRFGTVTRPVRYTRRHVRHRRRRRRRWSPLALAAAQPPPRRSARVADALPEAVRPFPPGLDRHARLRVRRRRPAGDLHAGAGDRARWRALTGDPAFTATTPRWSPDGARVVFASNRAHYEGAAPETGTPDIDLWVVDADGSRPALVSPAIRPTRAIPPGRPTAGAWCSSSDRDSRGDLYRLVLDTGAMTRLTQPLRRPRHHAVAGARRPRASRLPRRRCAPARSGASRCTC